MTYQTRDTRLRNSRLLKRTVENNKDCDMEKKSVLNKSSNGNSSIFDSGKRRKSEGSAEASTSNVPQRRLSSRSNKYSSSMKEPNPSIADLLDGQSPFIKISKVTNRRAANSSSSNVTSSDCDSDSDEGSFVDDGKGKRRKSPRNSYPAKENPTKKLRQAKFLTKKLTKSPVRRSSRRRKVVIEVQVSDDEVSSSSDEDEGSVDSEEDGDEMKIQRIIASRSETQKVWRDICSHMNTSEVDNGSRWFQDSGESSEEDEMKFEERYLVKWSGLSFLHCSWETKEDLIDQVDNAKTYLTIFFRKSDNGLLFDLDERADGEFYDPSYIQIERILKVENPEIISDDDSKSPRTKRRKPPGFAQKWGLIFDNNHPDYEGGTGRQFLIQWGSTSYSESQYEFERDLIINEVDYEDHLQSFLDRKRKPNKKEMTRSYEKHDRESRRLYKIFGDRIKDGEEKQANIETYKKKLEEKIFANGGQLRDYQAEGVSWLIANHISKRSSILADEMGLGKTIQTAVYVDTIATELSSRGPFLIVAPLSTIPHWQREFDGWTDLNTIVYHGSAKDREVTREFEFAFESDRPQSVGFNQSFLNKVHNRTTHKHMRTWMVQVVITTPEMLVTDDFKELAAVHWELLVVDEAHRLKNHSSKLALNLRNEQFRFNRTLLLTGTPIQNNMNELWTLMNIVDPHEFANIDHFMERYGDIKNKESVDELHGEIRPYILRRLKEDVEKSVPPKEETLIEVELTVLQKQYYRALYEKNVKFLHRNAKKALDGPSISNLAMQLRKCCNHPFLLKGVEDEVRAESGNASNTAQDEADILAKASGKLVLLDKLLPKLKAGGHRVLIFSQFKIMLDILEDYLNFRRFKLERIDGSITGKKRQMAIDRYQAQGSMDSSFVMLLSTRAGGVGINLTAADTCIIFDSDWNPQNDLQAQARCHRIGQTKSVKVYRLLSRKTYEMQMFHMSSLKMGLDQAVLQGIENATSDNGEKTMTKEEVEKLLRHGAYDIFSEDKLGESEKESTDFMAQDIDSILERRSKTVIHDNTGSKSNACGGTFSKASYKASKVLNDTSKETVEDVDIDDPEFWTKMIGETGLDDVDTDLSGKKRSRKKTNYSETFFDDSLNATISNDNNIDVNASDQFSLSDSDNELDVDKCKTDEDVFNCGSNSVLKNPVLQSLKEKKIAYDTSIERPHWGGRLLSEWNKCDAAILLKILLKSGYGHANWQEMFLKVKPDLSKSYEYIEMKRMCWALCLMTFREAVDDDVNEVAKRAERKALQKQKLNENKIFSSTASDKPEANISKSAEVIKDPLGPVKKNENQINLSFERCFSTHKSWITNVLEDAISFAGTVSPRNNNQAENPEKIELSLLTAFNESLWPALSTRGWKKEVGSSSQKNQKKVTKYGFGGQLYSSITEVLDVVPSVHKELSSTVECILSNTVSEIKCASNDSDVIQPALILANVNAKSLSIFLKEFAPFQLLRDRSKKRKLYLPRKNLDVLLYLHNAHFLIAQVKTKHEGLQRDTDLSKLLNVSPKAALPHPLWKPIHDAVLIHAIAKHGWIDRESSCLSITADASIMWGWPFDQGNAASSKDASSSKTDMSEKTQTDNKCFKRDELITAANRVLSVLNTDHIFLELKGFNYNLVMKSYGITQRSFSSENSDEEQSKWVLDVANFGSETEQTTSSVKQDASNESDQVTELPTRKDLVRRAKTVLSRSSLLAISTTKTSFSSTVIDAVSFSHEFGVLDQSNRCNIFLAELIRALVKLRPSQISITQQALIIAQREADFRYKDITLINEKGNKDSVETKDLKKVIEHLTFIRNNIPLTRTSKNILRVIVGNDPIRSKNPSEALFLEAKLQPVPKLPVTSAKKKISVKPPVKEHKQKKIKQKDCASGDTAINRALSIGRRKVQKNSEHEEEVSFLKLTTIEVLLMSVICSQGIPVFDNDWENLVSGEKKQMEECTINWHTIAGILKLATEQWLSISKRKLSSAIEGLSGLPKDEKKIEHLQIDVKIRTVSVTEAEFLFQNKKQLAKKAVMLLEKIRLRMGGIEYQKKKSKNGNIINYGLGPHVLQWATEHLVKWAEALEICKNGRPLSSTGAEYMADMPEIVPCAYLDKKTCKAIFMQLSQQTCLRSYFIKNSANEICGVVSKAIRSVGTSGDKWDGCPIWWGRDSGKDSNDDFELLSGILKFGYGGFDSMLRETYFSRRQINSRCSSDQSNKNDVFTLTRATAQHRVNQITRELHAIGKAEDSLRLMEEMKRNGPNSEYKASRIVGGNVQIGIDTFFKRS